MKPVKLSVFTLVVVVFASTFNHAVEAGYIGATATARSDPFGGYGYNIQTTQGPLSAYAHVFNAITQNMGSNPYVLTTDAVAQVTTSNYSPVLKFEGHADAGSVDGSANTTAASDMKWDDVIYVNSSSHPELYLTVKFTASISVSQYVPYYFNSSPTVSVSLSQNVGNTGAAFFSVQSDPSYPYGLTRQNNVWNSTNYANGVFTGYATFGMNYDPMVGGYIYELEDTLTAVANDGIAEINSDHSMDLISLTYANGTTPESQGFTVVTASGMPSPDVASVPEPSSIVLLALGIAGLAAHTGTRFRAWAVN
jgi:hypothetical protein